MEKTPTESSPVVIQSVQSDGVFNAGIILTETNYDVWSQIIEMHLAEREKLSYIRSSTKLFEESSKEYDKWYTYEIWDALSKAFYDGSDELQVFTLNQKAFSTKQNGQPLSKFYGELVEIFRELDHRDKVVMKDPEDVVIYRRSVERLRVHIFLAGLDEEFDQVRGEILRKDIIPDLEECYSLIRREDIRQSKLNKKVDSETSAMIARQQPQRKMTWIFLMKSKDEVNSLFQRFHKMVTTQFQTQIRVLHTDNGGEYMSTAIQQFLKSQGSVHQTTCVGTPQQNGVAERKNRHLLEVVRASLIQAHMPLSYWGEALASAAYLINRTPSSSLGFQTPFQVLNDAIMSPNVLNLPPHVFGCVAFVHLPQQEKLSPRALRCVCRGEYNEKEIHTLTYLPPEESQSSIEIVNLQDTGKANGDDSQAEICEDTFGEHNNSDITAIENESHEEIHNQSSAEDVPTTSPIRRILPQCQNRGIPKPTYEPDFSSRVKYPMSHFVSNHRLSESNQSFVNQLSVVSIPNSVQEALKDPKWKAAMNDEMRSLQKNQTWELVDLPPGKKPVGCRWIYTIKYKADGSIERYKARLVAKVQQFDVKNAFLHGDLSEEIYMDLPPGCSGPERLNQKVCKLKKSLYGLKQSPRAWFGKFTKAMVRFGYNQSNSDHTLFIKKRQGKITVLIVYVDDMVVTGNDEEETEALQKYLSREFEMKDLGALKYFLGIEVSRSKGGIFLSQRKYALDLLHETGMTACQPIDTPIEEGLKFCITSDQVPVDKGRYQRLIGRLMYLSHTRPDLAYALSVVSQFMHNPGEQHMKAVMRILRYLKTNPGKGILFSKNEDYSNIEVYTDADWAGSVSDRRSTSGYFTFVGGKLVTWRSKKQHVVARSSAEAEYRGMALGICEGLWISFILNDLGYPSQQPIQLYCDNKAARDITHNPVQHDRTKHVEVDRFFIKEKLDEKILELPKIRSEDQLADILTKAISSRAFTKFLDKLGMQDIYAPA
ncbi:retrovirus-related pol polyprotein from transposon RE1 [Citrus sinensis]|uniref:Retrovirus-related pol polyprotein from transposon RE1 n=1 Tax=Citrus sinensis TaxID=2711 RepID=A0ACB8NZ32_CITSI|nr:retrovirus-related pol polyprotein from transposon RE1 [Citrus sinensis]